MLEPTLKDLLKPLSAKTQPKSLQKNADGEDLTEEEAIAKQRRSVVAALGHKRRKTTNQKFNKFDGRRGARH